MIDPETLSARLSEFIAHLFPYEHGHRQKAITAFVAALIVQQTCCQAGLARAFDNFEAAAKRLSRLIHNERLKDRRAADAILQQSLRQLPAHGSVRLAIDWSFQFLSGDERELLHRLVSLVTCILASSMPTCIPADRPWACKVHQFQCL